MRWFIVAVLALFKPRAWLIAENICLRQQLAVLARKKKLPQLRNKDRRFWIVMCRWFAHWKDSLIVVAPQTVLRWHRAGWRAYWGWSSRRRCSGRKRMARENPLWGQQHIEAELAKLGYTVSPRTVAKYMRRTFRAPPSPGWKEFLNNHAAAIWACDFLTVRTLSFKTLYVFVVIRHATREIVCARVAFKPNAVWSGQQIVQACWDRDPPRFLIHDNDGIFGNDFNRRVMSLGIEQIRTPIHAPKANAIAERFIGTLRRECLDHVFIFSERHLQQVVDEFVVYYNQHRPHRSLNQKPPLFEHSADPPYTGSLDDLNRNIVSTPVLGGLHHVYRRAA